MSEVPNYVIFLPCWPRICSRYTQYYWSGSTTMSAEQLLKMVPLNGGDLPELSWVLDICSIITRTFSLMPKHRLPPPEWRFPVTHCPPWAIEDNRSSSFYASLPSVVLLNTFHSLAWRPSLGNYRMQKYLHLHCSCFGKVICPRYISTVKRRQLNRSLVFHPSHI